VCVLAGDSRYRFGAGVKIEIGRLGLFLIGCDNREGSWLKRSACYRIYMLLMHVICRIYGTLVHGRKQTVPHRIGGT
jgi:hypothetical protein